MSKDNTTSQPAQEYDSNICKTIPYYNNIQEETIRLIKQLKPEAKTFLEAGCGTGTFALKAMQEFANSSFTLSDPSLAMIDITKEKLAKKECRFILSGTENMTQEKYQYDVITAILAHHYAKPEQKKAIVANCYEMLKENGIYFTVETILKDSDLANKAGVELWRQAQIRAGKTTEQADKHVSRLGTELAPITLSAHLEMLRKAGFVVVQVFWISGMQAGIYAIK